MQEVGQRRAFAAVNRQGDDPVFPSTRHDESIGTLLDFDGRESYGRPFMSNRFHPVNHMVFVQWDSSETEISGTTETTLLVSTSSSTIS